MPEKAKLDKSSRELLLQAALLSLANALFQVIALKLAMRGPLVHERLAVSMVAGLAVFWLGIGAAVAPFLLKRSSLLHYLTAISLCVAALALPFVLETPSLYPANTILPITGTAALLSLPFCLLGVCLGIVFQKTQVELPGRAGKLAAASILGFVLGFLSANSLIAELGIWSVLFGCGCILLLLRKPVLSVGAAAFCMLLCSYSGLNKMTDSKIAVSPRFWLQHLAEQHEHLLGGWSPYARVDFYRAPDGTLAGLYNGTQQWTASPKPEDDFEVRRKVYAQLKGEVLLIGAGGGHGVVDLTAASSITAVELDPFVVKALKGELAEYNGEVYRKHTTIAADGRDFLNSTDKTFDYIILEGTDITVSQMQRSVISFENTLYTKEGLTQAARRLKASGVLIAGHALDSQPSVRFISGLPESLYWGAWGGTTSRNTQRSPLPFPVRLIAASASKQVLTEFAEMLSRVAPELKHDPPPYYDSRTQEKLELGNAITDLKPFLYFSSWEEVGALITCAAIICAVLCLAVIFQRPRMHSAYFASIGIGYMTMELYLLAVFRSLLGSYSLTFAAVMAVLSLSAVAGALYWERFSRRKLLMLGAIGFLLLWAVPTIMPRLGPELWFRVVFIAAVIAPLGIFMGAFLPAGLRYSKGRAARLLGIDAMGTSLGFALFFLLSLKAGFLAALGAAAICYTAALLAWPRVVKS